MKPKYHAAFLDMALRFGQTSEANRLKVGAILVRDGKILSQGVNGQPPKWHTEVCEDADGKTLPTVRHAEIACLEKLWNSSETAEGATMYISHSPCLSCSIKLLTAGISSVYFKTNYRCDDGVKFLVNHGITVQQLKDEDYETCNEMAPSLPSRYTCSCGNSKGSKLPSSNYFENSTCVENSNSTCASKR